MEELYKCTLCGKSKPEEAFETDFDIENDDNEMTCEYCYDEMDGIN